MQLDLNLMVGGEAGQGIQTIGFVLGKTLVRSGLHVFADQDYESRIRGGHNFYRVRASDRPVGAQNEKLDILVAMNSQSFDLHKNELKENGIVIMDKQSLGIESSGPGILEVPLEKLAEESSGGKITANSVAAGAVFGLLGGDLNVLSEVLNQQLAKNSGKVREDNLKALRAGYEYAAQRRPSGFIRLPQPGQSGRNMFLNSNEALVLGAVAGGCQFVAAYPMTPITPILEHLMEKAQECEMVVIQPEDEIAAINMVVGASFAGARAMTATSGSGFALMVEGIGLAGITETPAVIVLGQRPGPAVGLPTRTEQGELLLAIHGGTGEFPRAVLAPANVEDAFYLTAKALNLAEKYQIPVIILTDTHLANSYSDTAEFALDRIKIERGALLTDPVAAALSEYQRYALSDTGISPRVLPGQGRVLVAADSDEHDEDGHLTEKAEIRARQNAKRLKKYAGLKAEISPPRWIKRPGAEITLIGWGSTFGAICEASDLWMAQGVTSNVLHLTEIWPFPAEFVSGAMRETAKNVVIENNATGQLVSLIRAETGLPVSGQVNKWDGRPLSARYILHSLEKGAI
jgi:2-oxoglutarate/2-oxoacid ferredoxin oxidoreductase subunit alpha